MITFFVMSQRKVLSLSVGIPNLATWQYLTLLDKGFTFSKYPIGINVLAHILAMAIMPPIRVAISISMIGEDV